MCSGKLGALTTNAYIFFFFLREIFQEDIMPSDQSIPCIKRKQNLDYLAMSINASIFPQSLAKSAKNNQVTKRKERNGETLRSWNSGDWEQEQTFLRWEQNRSGKMEKNSSPTS